jgi:cell division protein FtsI/penicillin-binding protein 2
VFPAGTGQTGQQLQAIAELRPQGYCGTPSFLRILIEKALEAKAKRGAIVIMQPDSGDILAMASWQKMPILPMFARKSV